MKAVLKFIAGHGFSLMLYGFMTTAAGIVACVVIYENPRFAETAYHKAAIALAFIGLAVYVVGRVSVSMQRRRAHARGGRSAAADDDDE